MTLKKLGSRDEAVRYLINATTLADFEQRCDEYYRELYVIRKRLVAAPRFDPQEIGVECERALRGMGYTVHRPKEGFLAEK